MTIVHQSTEPRAGADSDEAPHQALPRPTYAPAAMALGITFLLGGLVTSVVVLGAGAALIVASIIGWIGDMRHEP